MKVSVISIAKDKEELEPLKEALRKQTFRDWEFVYSTKKGIPQAWNSVIRRAKGEIILITESDALPMTDKWIEEMVNAVEQNKEVYAHYNWSKGVFIRGMEIHPSPWCFSNIACYAKVLKENLLDESYPIAEDTELFSRLYTKGYAGREILTAPVMHKRNFKGFTKEIKNSYLYGKLHTRIRKKYKGIGFGYDISGESVLKREITTIFSRIAFLFGILRGLI